MLGTVAACLALGFFSVSFFTGNTILIKKKGDLYQLANVLGSSSTLSEKLRVNLTAFPQRGNGEERRCDDGAGNGALSWLSQSTG